MLTEGHEVLCLDNFFTGRKQNIQDFFGNHRFELVRHDVIEPIMLEVDQIYHLACPASPIHYQYNAIKTIKTNVLGTHNMLGLAKRVKARFLLASTSEVYGDPVEHPQTESYWGNVNPIGIRSCYDEGKRVAETFTMDYHRQNGVDVRIVRIFNTYGPRMLADDGRVVSNFIVQSLQGKDLTVYGEGQQTRSFCYADDLIDGMVRMMNNPDFIGPVNIGNPSEYTIRDFAEKIIAMTGTSSKIAYEPLPSDDPRQRCPDITLAGEKLGWKPLVSVDDGLKRTIEYFKKELSA
ncbi:MAG TPA: NAD-dependent dehydratase [Nitrospiraceae bacterium]|nr:NAD-dependent dehydratase [Nitrospiraceae bacterium]